MGGTGLAEDASGVVHVCRGTVVHRQESTRTRPNWGRRRASRFSSANLLESAVVFL